MLPPFIIEQLRRREQERKQPRPQPRLELPLESPRPADQPKSTEEPGVLIIPLWD